MESSTGFPYNQVLSEKAKKYKKMQKNANKIWGVVGVEQGWSILIVVPCIWSVIPAITGPLQAKGHLMWRVPWWSKV